MSQTQQTDVSGMETYTRLLQYVKPYWKQFGIAIIGMVMYAAADTSFAALMKPLLDGNFVEKDPETIKYVPILILCAFFARGIATFLSSYYMSWIGWRVIKKIRNQLFDKYLTLPTAEYDQMTSGELISKVSYDVTNVSGAATKALTILIRDTLTVIGLLGLMFYHSWQLTLGCLLIGPIIGLIVSRVSRKFRKISRRIQKSMGNISHVVEETIEGHRVVKVFGGQQYERDRFEEINERNRTLHLKMTIAKSISSPTVHFLVAIALAAIIHLATKESVVNEITVGSFMSFIVAMMMLFGPLRQLTNVVSTLQKGVAAGESVFAMIDMPPEIDTGTEELDQVRGEVVFKNVSFSYASVTKDVLSDVSFNIEPGQVVAIVGRSGSGKTTLVNLLARLYEASSGEILIDGHRINDLQLLNLRDQMAYVGQHVTLFNDSIANNIAYGRLSGVSRGKIQQASEAAHAAEFIEQLPQGYDTPVGENGVLLSGGQRQRIAIARALLKDAPILILDEATSALDTESERKVQEGLNALLQNRTTLIIAHRLSTIENADRIIVMDNGQIIESGTHRELLMLDKQYARLHKLQFTTDDSTPSH